VLATACKERDLRNCYQEASGLLFTIFVSVDGAIRHEAVMFLHCLAKKLLDEGRVI